MLHAIRFHFPRITSTNDYAKTLLAEHDCVAITADGQTAGRGRHNRVWTGGQYANVYCSFGVRHRTAPTLDTLFALQGLGCLSTLYALRQVAPEHPFFLKYPNDVYTSIGTMKKKIGGILIENEFIGATCTMSIIGIGVNVLQRDFPEELQSKATSLTLTQQQPLSPHTPQRIANLLITYIEEHYATSPSILMQVWQRELCSPRLQYKIIGDTTAELYTPDKLLP